tara:strand:- start:2541 stop:3806 length:1266 start_codon:yes stop_codon:yes gene_type:complete
VVFPKIKLVDIVDVKGGKRLPKGEDFENHATKHPYIRARDIRDGNITFDDPVYISQKTHSKISRYVTLAGDICITIVGANVGDVGQVPAFLDGANLTENAVKLVGKSDDYLAGYLKHALLIDDAQKQMKNFAAGAAQPKLGIYKINEVEVFYPDFGARKEIDQILSSYNNLIENNNRRIAILEDMAQSLYREWFVKFRYPGHENQTLIDSPLGPIPEGWEVKTLKELTSKIGSGATPRGGKDAYKSDGIPLIRSLNIYDASFITKDLALIDDQQAAKLKNVIVQPRDVLLNITGASVARCAMVPKEFTPARVNQHVAIIRANIEAVSPEFILYTLISANGKSRLLNLAQGGATREAITKTHIEKFSVVVPPQAVFESFNEIVNSVVRKAHVLFVKNENLRKQRDMLLPKLISGKIDLTKEY